ncbi:MAG: hypothetical protein WCL32_14525 [Planctomycetota bacterium]|jgi:hypothetical protein
MTSLDLLTLLRAKPFVPIRIYATDGRTHDIRHPDQALVLKSRIVLPLGTGDDIAELSEHWSLLHIVRAEELATGGPSKESLN